MVKKLEIDPINPKQFISCSQDGTSRLFDLRDKSEKILVNLNVSRGSISSRFLERIDINGISLNQKDPNYFIIGGGDRYVRLYDRRYIDNGNVRD
jgi:DDB1- and CUL4-associated factor 8